MPGSQNQTIDWRTCCPDDVKQWAEHLSCGQGEWHYSTMCSVLLVAVARLVEERDVAIDQAELARVFRTSGDRRMTSDGRLK